MQLLRRYWPIWLILVLIALAYWPGRVVMMNVLTEREAARIASITPDAGAEVVPERLNIDRMMADLIWLADAEREGRAPGTDGGIAAREYIVEQMTTIGLEPAGTDGYLHPFETPQTTNAANVIGLIPGTDPNLRPITLTAHYDHLGIRNGAIYHGADDNASGTAAILEIARFLMDYPNEHPILVMALDSEEWGLLGARALFETNFLDPRNVAFNLNLDMLSRDTDQLLYAVGTYHNPWLRPLVQRVQRESGARLVMAHDRPWWRAGRTEDWTLSSDHGPFHEQGIPFMYFGVADHPDYHRPTDTSDKVDVEFYRKTSETALSFLLLIDQVFAEKRNP
ncbi:MAG: M28 family peptidase [Idiomarina sp.]|nr:M28 family peptidase [Idiomarina sp.]